MNNMYVLYPISEEERERLGLTEFENSEEPNEVIGVMLTPSRAREGIKRWITHGKPTIFSDDYVSDAMKVVKQSVEAKHQQALNAVIQDNENTLANLHAEFEEKYNTQQKELKTVKQNEPIYQKRLRYRDEKIEEKDAEIAQLKESEEREKTTANTYAQRFGYTLRGTDPLNGLQRFVAWLFRI